MAKQTSLNVGSKAYVVTAIFLASQYINEVHVLTTSLPGQGR